MSLSCLKTVNASSYLQNKFKLHTTVHKGTHGLFLAPFPSLLWWPSPQSPKVFSIHYHSWHPCWSLHTSCCHIPLHPSCVTKPSPTSNTTTKPVLSCLKTLLKYLFPFRGFPNVLSSMICHHSLFSLLFLSSPTMKFAFMKVYISPLYIHSISCVTLFWHSHIFYFLTFLSPLHSLWNKAYISLFSYQQWLII